MLHDLPASTNVSTLRGALLLQLPASMSNLTVNYSGVASGSLNPTAIAGALAADKATNIVPEAGTRLWVIEPPVASGAYEFTLNYEEAGTAPLPYKIKFIFAEKVIVDGRAYYPPLFPCTHDLAGIPAITLPTAQALAAVNLSPISPQKGCASKNYNFGAATTVEVIEFYNQSLDHYFITWGVAEIAALDAGTVIKGWVRTGHKFKAHATPQPGTSDVCRFYIPPALGDSHFFGRGAQECADTKAKFPLLVEEDPKYMQMILPVAGVCPAGTINIYRVFSGRTDANHRYMIDKGLRDLMVTSGWIAEGDGADRVVMCAPV